MRLPPAQLDYMKTRFAMRKRQLAPEDPGPGEQQGDENPPPHLQGMENTQP